MLAFLRGAAIVGAIAFWSTTHEGGAALRRGDEPDAPRPSGGELTTLVGGLRQSALAPARLAELHRAVRDAEPARRALVASHLADAAFKAIPTRSAPVRQVYPFAGQANGAEIAAAQ